MAAPLRSVVCAARAGWTLVQRSALPTLKQVQAVPSVPTSYVCRGFRSLQTGSQSVGITALVQNMNRLSLQPITPLVEQVRTKVRYSRMKGKPKTVHSVPDRFYRLNWGIWIRTRAGRGKRLWTKPSARRHRLRQHVFCNKTQSKLLDKMVTKFWRRPKYWVDDPYALYQKRTNFPEYFPEKRQFYP